MNEISFLKQVHKRLAQVSVGASALRNQGDAGLIKATRSYLETRIVLAEFFQALTDEAELSEYLDENTSGLLEEYSPLAQSWGAARKGLNLFFREVVYNKFMADQYGLPKDFGNYNQAIKNLEIPLDKDVASAIWAARTGNLSKWPGIKYLDATLSKAYQTEASRIAQGKGIARIHLDLEYWRKKKMNDAIPTNFT